jgi:hypothetical protein
MIGYSDSQISSCTDLYIRNLGTLLRSIIPRIPLVHESIYDPIERECPWKLSTNGEGTGARQVKVEFAEQRFVGDGDVVEDDFGCDFRGRRARGPGYVAGKLSAICDAGFGRVDWDYEIWETDV